MADPLVLGGFVLLAFVVAWLSWGAPVALGLLWVGALLGSPGVSLKWDFTWRPGPRWPTVSVRFSVAGPSPELESQQAVWSLPVT